MEDRTKRFPESVEQVNAKSSIGVVGVTGATGFVGRGLLAALERDNIKTVAFARDVAGGRDGPAHRRYSLADPPSADALAGIDVLVHCAFIVHGRTAPDSSEINVRGTLALFEAARRAGARFIFLSSLSALHDARSEYGMHKYALETALRDTEALVLRPGLVVGDGGLVRNVYEAARRGFVPLVDGGRQATQIVALDDLAEAVVLGAAQGLRGAHVIASRESVSVRELVTGLCRRFALAPRCIDVPWHLAWALAAAAERAGLRLPLTKENLLGIRCARYQRPSSAFEALGWTARRWEDVVATLELEEGR